MTIDYTKMTNEEFLSSYFERVDFLRRIFHKEVQYMRNQKIANANKLIDTKNDLLTEIEKMQARIINDEGFKSSLTEEQKTQIKLTIKQLEEDAYKSFQASYRVKEVNRLVYEYLADAQVKSDSKTSNYNHDGYSMLSDSRAISLLQEV